VGVLEPPPAVAPGTTQIDILVATTRAPAPERAVLFSGERGEASLASLVVSIPPDSRRQIGRVQWPRRLPPDPSADFALVKATSLAGWTQTENWLRRRASHRVLVFVHGFNNRFEAALFRLAQIVHDSGADVAPVLFSWPSRGNVFDYSYDRESANFSRDALEKLLRRLAASPTVREVVVLAHSMGAWLATESLRQLAIRDGRAPKKISTVILASPDLDVDVFRSQLRSLGEARPRFVVFLSREDRALRLSRSIAGNVARLGGADPAAKPWLEEKGVEVVDLTGKESADPLRHGKFAENPEVVRFLGEQLINGDGGPDANLGERLGGVSMGVAQGVSGAAGLAITAPIAVVDPQMRRAYSNQLDQVRQAIDNVLTSGSD
jgi:esterase/lipase superfamily enzyme